MSPANDTPDISLQNITVTFGAFIALDHVSVRLRPGERHAIIGENGAGKSTLMRVLFGLQSPDHGDVLRNGSSIRFSSPADAMANGIGMVQQHFELVADFTVAENILLGAEKAATRQLRFHRKTAAEIVSQLSEQSGLPIDPIARVGDLSVAAQQRVEILKALYRNVRVLILDEPTAVLSPSEATDLWKAVSRLSQTGTTVVFVTHKLDDVMANADTVTVLRRGKHILTSPTSAITPEALAQAMIGESRITLLREEPISSPVPEVPNKSILQLEQVTIQDKRGVMMVQDATLTINTGEILGIAGVDGSGQTELLEAIIGLRPLLTGTMRLDSEDITHDSVAQRRRKGIAYIPADRHRQAVVLPLSCAENIVLGQQHCSPFVGVGGILHPRAMETFLKERCATFDVRGAGSGVPLKSLSGGNQQKLVLARELSQKPRVLIAAQPTRGLDFAAMAFVHRTLRQERDRGGAILLQSLDLAEIIALADRVAVMRAGRVVALLNVWETTQEQIGAWMTGAGETPAQ